MFIFSKFVSSISVLAGAQPSAYAFFQLLALNLSQRRNMYLTAGLGSVLYIHKLLLV